MTAFQRQVWAALSRIPAGATSTYGRIAAEIGRPRAARAVGQACGSNPVAIAIPCHRALRNDGAIGGYAWGSQRKQALISAESASLTNGGGPARKKTVSG
jgi:AraC family transcriptional regulator of adaptative response/methylated-DNA-[protein]-cysteine methyltransferase